MHSIIEEKGFLKGNSQEIIKKLTDKELKEVAPNIWELNSEQSIWMADMWADEKDGFMCGYRMGFQDMVENPTRFDGIPYYNSVYICTKEGKEKILCKYKEIFLFEKVDGGYEFKGVYSLDGGIDGDSIWFKRKSSLSIKYNDIRSFTREMVMKVIRVTHAQYGLGNGEICIGTNGYNIKVEFDCGSTTTFDYNYTFEKGILKLADPNDKLPFPIVMIHQTTPKSSSTPNLSNILKRYIADFNQKQRLPFVVKESIPIVWFGDIDAYFNSDIKIVTIGLNPSEQEFMYKDDFNNMIALPDNEKRFDIIDFTKLSVDEQVEELKTTLNNYFNKNPYKWFNKYEKLLSAKECSYYKGKKDNTAIHIDLFSAIATTPTWGKLNNKQKFQIENKNLFLDLLEILNPDFALCSVNNDTFLQVFNNYNKINQQKFAGNNYIRVYKKNGADRIILNGTNMQGTPWGGMQEVFSKIIINTPNADCENCKHYLSNNCGGIKLCTNYKS